MVEGWVTALVIVFGVAVAVAGVVAYLRMFRKHADSTVHPSVTGDSNSRITVPSQQLDSQLLSEDGDQKL
ncbi:hypothetical protein DFQ01_11980 [Paenibacillus cellulosilyticus]|uniref:Uncharacterized protein n=1 Tax=Paenibacillus cellulosilyticus TaxID=375489 RepID=A0A2V2YQL5_9BACL|nr:hypothetical protein [Paenibacillus cellulosilyticus]PWV97998.1 hypothetical protein DFQ01_11980 [Paenibacillus cellulosilyticus]QKS43977.1 hypothetical protein HUB94_05695 [Paenibacillus cellulosilyticus]